jgi:hypothetical protein
MGAEEYVLKINAGTEFLAANDAALRNTHPDSLGARALEVALPG